MVCGVAQLDGRKRERLEGVQAARGAAALLVVLYHCGHMLSLPQYIGRVPLGDAFEFGHAGVDFFFVLSGFIITYVHRADLGRPERLPRYAWRRFARIVPMYWVVTAITVAVALASPERGERLAPGHVLESLLFVPHGRAPVVGVGWTLEQEVLFYAAFGVAVAWRRLGPPLAAIGVALAVAGPWLPKAVALDYLTCSYHVHFLLGIGVALLVQRGAVPMPRAVAVAGAAAFLLAGAAEDAGLLGKAGYVSQACFGLASAAVLAGLVEAERQGKLRVGSALSLLGAASYSIYLIHTLAIGVVIHSFALVGIMALLPGWGAMLLGTGVGLGSGLLLHLHVERPLTELMRRLEPGKWTTAPSRSLVAESPMP